MRFLILGLNYLPESTSIGPYTADLAEHLKEKGHYVQVVTGFPVAPHFRIWDEYRGKRFMREQINGVDVLRTYLYVPQRPGRAAGRIAFDLSFMASSFIGGLVSGPFDVVCAVSPPLQIGITALALARLKRTKAFLHIKDLVPDAAIAAGFMTPDSTAAHIGYALERTLCRKVDGVGVICEGFKTNLIEKGVPSEKVELVPDYVDLKFMQQMDRDNGFRRRHELSPGDFVVTYSGSVALKQGLEVFVETAAQLEEEAAIKFFLIGDGPYLSALRRVAEDLSAKRLHFLPIQPRSELPEQLGAADVLVITQRKAVTDCVFPGKLLYYMAAGRPILAAVSKNSETGNFIERHQVGMVVPPEEPRALAEGIKTLKDNRVRAANLGANGRAVVERMFERTRVLADFERVLTNLGA